MAEPVARVVLTVFSDGEVSFRKLPLTTGGAPAMPRAAARKGPSARSAPARPSFGLNIRNLELHMKGSDVSPAELGQVLGFEGVMPSQPQLTRLAREWAATHPEAYDDLEVALVVAALDIRDQTRG